METSLIIAIIGAVFFILFWGLILFGIFKNVFDGIRFNRIKKLIEKFSNSVSNEQVEKLIKMIRKYKLHNVPEVWNTLRAGFTLVNNSEEVSYELKKELMNVLLSKGVNLGNVKIHKSKKEVEQENRIQGLQGEENIQHNLKFLTMAGYKVLNNVKIPNSVYPQEIDHIVIGPNGLFHIETKNYEGYGKIIIDKNGNWIKEKDGIQTSIKNPLAQVDRHDMAIKEYLRNELPDIHIPIVPLIVQANDNYIIEIQGDFPIPVLKNDQLTYFIKNYKSEIQLKSEQIERIYNKLSALMLVKNIN